MKLLTALIVCIFLTANVKADNRVKFEDLFPLTAHHMNNKGSEWIAQIKLHRNNLYLTMRSKTIGLRVNEIGCQSRGLILSGIDQLGFLPDKEFNTICGGSYSQGNWGKRRVSGTIKEMKMENIFQGTEGDATFSFVGPKLYREYVAARNANVGGSPFGTEQYLVSTQKLSKLNDYLLKFRKGSDKLFLEPQPVMASSPSGDCIEAFVIRKSKFGSAVTTELSYSVSARESGTDASIRKLPCNELDIFRSRPSGSDVQLTITSNFSKYKDLQLWWIDFEGNEKYYGELNDRSVMQKTYIDHIWIIRGNLKEVTKQPVQTVVADNSADVEFWKSVKGSSDPDMFREYLRQFPQGVYAGLAKLKVKKLVGVSTSVAQSSIPNLDYGDYFALVIGNNRYDHLSQLRTAVSDARSVANLLELDYGFNVTTLENADRNQIIKSISGLRSKVTSEDNVLIYYAGHGYLDEAADEGFWLPTDASPDDPSNWITTDRIVGQVRAMKAKHVMVVADSCFSGTITRGIKIEIKQPTREWLETIVKKKARTALTSGGLEPVMDSGSGNNSVFANSFLSILRDNDGVLDASQLFSQLRPKVMINSDQTPEYGDIHRAGHDGGDFLFVRR